MKFNKKLFFPFFLLIITTAFVTSCEITDPVEGLEIRLNSQSRETLVSGYTYDANTLQPVAENLSVTFVGENSNKIVDESNERKSVFTVKNGMFVFGIEDGTEITSSDPFEVNVIIGGNNYSTETQKFVIKKTGFHTQNFYLINPSTLPNNSDSDYFELGNTDNSGALLYDVQHTTSMGTTISIASGTVMLDENGLPVTGELLSQITVIPLTPENQYNAPQSFTTSTNETVNPVVKFDFKITNGTGNSVDHFSQSVSFSIPVPDGLELPVTDGEILPLWKQNNLTGDWEKVGQTSVSTVSLTGKSDSKIMTGILNGTTVDAGSLLFGISEETCDASLEITNVPLYFNSAIQFFDEDGRLIVANKSWTVEFEFPTTGLTIKSIRLNAELSDPFNTGIEIGSDINLHCGYNSTALNFPVNLVNMQVRIVGVCTSREPVIVVNPNITFSYKTEGSSTWQSGTLVNGKTILSGLKPGNYEMVAAYQDHSGKAGFQIVNSSTVNVLEVDYSENLLSADVDTTTEPVTFIMEIDIGDECN